MPEFLAGKIMEAREISLEEGKNKYKTYFFTLEKLYSKYQKETNAILEQKDCADCIVKEQQNLLV